MNTRPQYKFIPCTLCGSSDYAQMPFTRSVFSDGMAAIFACRRCGMTPYFSTFPDNYERIMKEVYYEEGFYTAKTDVDGYLRKIRTRLNEIDLVFPLKGSRFLDVGCGEGLLLKEAQAAGASVEGVEPEAAQSRALQLEGFNVFGGLISEFAEKPDKSYDIIALEWVVDSMKDPVADLRKIRRLVSDDGLLHISIGSRFRAPLFSRSKLSIVQKPLSVFVPRRNSADHHPYHFTHTSLISCLQYVGFRVAEISNRYVRNTSLIARPDQPKQLEEIDTEDWRELRRYFVQWKLRDVFALRLYHMLAATRRGALPLASRVLGRS